LPGEVEVVSGGGVIIRPNVGLLATTDSAFGGSGAGGSGGVGSGAVAVSMLGGSFAVTDINGGGSAVERTDSRGGSLRLSRLTSSSSSLCFRPASQRRLLSSEDSGSAFSVCEGVVVARGDSRTAPSSVSIVGLAIKMFAFGLWVRIASASLSPLRFAHSIALRPRLSRSCGSAPALIRIRTRFVWPKMTARMRAVWPPLVLSLTSAPSVSNALTARSSPDVTACVNGMEELKSRSLQTAATTRGLVRHSKGDS